MRIAPALLLAPLLALGALCLHAPEAQAGGGPETTLIVVNQDSPTSWRIANTYAHMRGIPATHLCPIPAPPSLVVITIDQFRERIWKPIEEYIAKHGLEEEIDTIAYSADFPYGVDYRADFELKPKERGQDKLNWPPVAALTGVTYLNRHVKAKSREYLALNTNQYLRVDQDGEIMPGHGFRHAYAWNKDIDAEKVPEDPETPDRYYLSTMLGFTGIQGNTVEEIEAYLTAAHGVDGKSPKGTVYLMVNKDVRARTRAPQFEDTEKALKRLGAKVVRLEAGKDGQDGKCPIDKGDVMGCVAGIAGFNWAKSKSQMLPGAIAEHLTSFGARFDGSGQTKISEYLRAGAAGSSGAVAEPYALWQKFPLATLHVHYREGCSLAESFYQTVAGPYQLLVVGDPLARPYATLLDVAFAGGTPKKWTGTASVQAKVSASEAGVAAVELWVDGQRVATSALDKAIEFDTTKFADGTHDVRLVAIEKSRIETRSSIAARIEFDNGGSSVTIKAPKKPTPWGASLKLTGKASKAKEIVVISGHRELGKARRIGATMWKLELDTRLLGEGTTPVQARVTTKDGAVSLSPIADLVVSAPGTGKATKRRKKPRRKKGAKKATKGGAKAGLRIIAVDAKGKEHTFAMPIVGVQGKQRFLTSLRKTVKGNPKSIRLEGEVEIKADGTYRLAFNAGGKLAVKIKGVAVFEGEGLAFDRQAYTAVALKAGWHPIEVEYTPSGNGDLSIWLGGAVVSGPLMGKALRH